jgi:WD40 repeat protein
MRRIFRIFCYNLLNSFNLLIILEGVDMKLSLSLERRLGLGRLRAAAWLDNQTVLVATQANVWRWQPAPGTVTSLVALGAERLSVQRAAGLAAVAVNCPTRELVVFALEDGHVVRRLPGHGGDLIYCIALSPDGRLLASGGSDRMLRIREIAMGQEVRALEHPGGFSSMDGNPEVVAWTSDGNRLATADNDRRLWLWDVATGAQLVEARLPLRARALAFAPDGETLVAGLNFGGGTISRDDRFLAVLDGQTGEIQRLLDTPTENDGRGGDIWTVAFSPDGRYCAVGDDEGPLRNCGAIHVFDTTTWQRAFHLQNESRQRTTVSDLEFSPDGTQLLAVSASEVNRGSGTVEFALDVWDTHAWARTARLEDFVGQVNDLAPLPGGDLLAATDEGVRRYARDANYTTLLPGNVHKVAVAPDGKHAVVTYASFDGEARLLDLQSKEVGDLLPGITKRLIRSAAFLSDSQRYVICHDTYWLRKVGRKTAIAKLPPLEASDVDHLSAAASVDGKVAFVSWRSLLTVRWGKKLEQGTPWTPHPGPGRRLNAVTFAPDGQQVAAASGFYRRGVHSEDRRGRIFVWTLPAMTVRELVTSTDHRWFEAIAWSPKNLIAAGTRNGIICLFDAAQGEFLDEFVAHGTEITALHFAANGVLLSASADGSIGVWRV